MPIPPSSPPPLSLDDVRRIARLLHEADLSEIEIETLPTAAASSAGEDAVPEPRVRLQLRRGTDASVMRRVSAPALPRPSASQAAGDSTVPAAQEGDGSWEVLSPTVGIFRATQPPLQVGDEVRAGQKAGAVEALKIPSDILFVNDGRVSAVLAEDDAGVEYAQPLFRLEPLR